MKKAQARTLQIVCAVVVWAALTSCNKEEAFDCFKTTGPESEIRIDVDYFHEIDLYDNMGLVLRNGNLPEVIIRGGQNVIGKISAKVQDSTLVLENLNFCNWVRDYQSITVEVAHPALQTLRLFGYGPVSNEDTLFVENVLFISATESTSTIDLVLSGQHLVVFSNNANNMNLSGRMVVAGFGFYFNDAIMDARNLDLQTLEIHHQGYSDMHFSVSEEVRGELLSSGNLILYTQPQVLDVEEKGDGKVIFNTE